MLSKTSHSRKEAFLVKKYLFEIFLNNNHMTEIYSNDIFSSKSTKQIGLFVGESQSQMRQKSLFPKIFDERAIAKIEETFYKMERNRIKRFE